MELLEYFRDQAAVEPLAEEKEDVVDWEVDKMIEDLEQAEKHWLKAMKVQQEEEKLKLMLKRNEDPETEWVVDENDFIVAKPMVDGGGDDEKDELARER